MPVGTLQCQPGKKQNPLLRQIKRKNRCGEPSRHQTLADHCQNPVLLSNTSLPAKETLLAKTSSPTSQHVIGDTVVIQLVTKMLATTNGQ
jgi:hypothetical protein